jgi:hypothetical protein
LCFANCLHHLAFCYSFPSPHLLQVSQSRCTTPSLHHRTFYSSSPSCYLMFTLSFVLCICNSFLVHCLSLLTFSIVKWLTKNKALGFFPHTFLWDFSLLCGFSFRCLPSFYVLCSFKSPCPLHNKGRHPWQVRYVFLLFYFNLAIFFWPSSFIYQRFMLFCCFY